ncbi:MAG TPA: 50S ribosomal protein L29 [Steroidobacteraceae bacterium]
MSKKNIKERGRFLKSLRGKDLAGLRSELGELRREQFNLRMAAASGQPARPDQYAKVRGKIARLKTVLVESERAKVGGSRS